MATNESVKSAVATREDNAPATTDIRTSIEAMKPEFARVIGDTVGVERFTRIALTELRYNPDLMRCSPDSVLGSLMSAAQLNLEVGRSTGEAWLVPFANRKTGEFECTFIVGYKGLLKLAWQSGQVLSLTAQTVREQDDFDFTYGLDPFLRHKPARSGRGDSYAWYAAARIKGGGSAFEVLYREDVERIRERSRAKDGGPWRTDYDAMAKKTAIRQLAKYLPMSAEFNYAVANDDTVRTNTSAEQLESAVYERDDQDVPL